MIIENRDTHKEMKMTGTETYTITLKNVRGIWTEDIKGILNLFDRLDEIADDEWVRLESVGLA